MAPQGYTNPMDFGDTAPPAPGPQDAFQDPSSLDAFGEDPYAGDDQYGNDPYDDQDRGGPPPPPQGGSLEARKINPETGVCPRRCSDIIWCPAFTAFMIFLFVIALIFMGHEDQERMRHGFDAQANLCGHDEDVKDFPYLYFCRKDTQSTVPPTTASEIDLIRPSCVARCPREGLEEIICLTESQNTARTSNMTALGAGETNIVTSRQEKLFTKPYNTSLRQGMQCLPDNEALREEMFHQASPGTQWWYFRVAFGGLLRVWGIFAVVTCAALVLGYIFLFIYEACLNWVILALAVLVAIPLIFFGIAFGCAFIAGGIARWDWYMDEFNPFYARGDIWASAIVSTIFGVILLGIGLKLCWDLIPKLFKRDSAFDNCFDLIRATFEGLRKNPFLFALPLITAWVLFFVFWIFTWAIVSMLSAGTFENYRVFVNGVQFAGLSRLFYMEWWRWIFIALMAIGGFWALNYVVAFHQYIITSVLMKWYYSPKERVSDGAPQDPLFQSQADFVKPGQPKDLLDAFMEAGFWHSGTLFLSAAWIGVYRFVYEVILFPLTALNCVSRSWENSKDAYMDTVMRANDFAPARECTEFRMTNVSKTVDKLKHNFGGFSLLAALYAMAIGVLIAWLMVRNIDGFREPGRNNYVLSPVLISTWAAILSVMVVYSVIALLDVGVDAMLGAYAWNKKFNKKTIEKFIPVSLRYCIGWEELKSDKYPYYGKADRNMYLNTYFNAGTDDNPGLFDQAQTQMGTSMASMRNFATGYNQPQPGY